MDECCRVERYLLDVGPLLSSAGSSGVPSYVTTLKSLGLP